MTAVLVIVAGAFGALARYGVIGLVQERVRDPRPWGTLVVNVSGAAILGFIVGLASEGWWVAPASVGFVGGYTTFSTWMIETIYLAEGGGTGAVRSGAWNLAGTIVLGLAAAGTGLVVGRVM
jgi:CrcB protein